MKLAGKAPRWPSSTVRKGCTDARVPRTTFDPEPKVGVRHIDLLNLYRRVTEEGGYDLVSDRDAKPLMWRKLAEEFVGKNQYTAAQAFQIKNVYYKNLCAYEISTHWGKEPPPKEILEEVTAKGGNVMSRTLDNFARPSSREQVNLENGDASDNSPEEQKTPEKEKPEEDSNGAGARTRGLRQQPPQRVLFQPDLTSARQNRSQTTAAYGSPTPTGPGTNGIMNTASWASGASSTLASYEPSQSYPLSLKPATTPANNPEFYRLERKRKLEANAGPLAKKYKNIMLPGTGFIGPSIYTRAQLALQCGLPEEEQYALHHLVKISHERGDKYRFDQFPGLAEALVKKALQVSSLFYDVEWDVTYDEDSGTIDDEVLNGLHGTSDIIQRLRSKIPLVSNDSIQDADFLSKMNRITEAGLIIRNMCMHDDNAKYLSMQPMARDYLAIVLNLPQHSSIVELQHYALEAAEQILKHCDIGRHDALYHSLLMQLDREDRGAVTLALRAISRIAMHLKLPKRLDDVSDNTLQKAQDWLMVEDEELRTACLDFLMQYTSFADNVDNLLQAVDAELLVRQLSRLLFSGAKEHKEQKPLARPENDDSAGPVPRLSKSVVEALLKLDEPERSSEWLRMCFLADVSSEMTQISLWQAYQATFSAFHATHPHLVAGDFIKNVSNTFMGATAQVAGSNKYVIRGIKPRKVPVDTSVLSGVRTNDKPKELQKCCWKVSTTVESPRDPLTGMQGPPMTRESECAEWFRDGRDLLKHILNAHLRIPSKKVETVKHEEGMEPESNSTPVTSAASPKLTNGTGTDALGSSFDFQAADNAIHHCRWANCTRTSQDYEASKTPRTLLLARHIQTHLPDTSSAKNEHNLKPQTARQLASTAPSFMTSLQDEKNDAAGVPLGAALVLRNIAKFIPQKTSAVSAAEGMREVLGGEKVEEKDEQKDTPIGSVFNDSVQDTLFYAFAHQRTVRDYVGYIFRAIRASGG